MLHCTKSWTVFVTTEQCWRSVSFVLVFNDCEHCVAVRRDETKIQKKMMARLNELFARTSVLEASQFTRIILVRVNNVYIQPTR